MSDLYKKKSDPFSIEIHFELKETHCLILLSLLFFGEMPPKGLNYAVRILKETNYDYFELLKIDIKQYISKLKSCYLYQIGNPYFSYKGKSNLADPTSKEIEKCKEELIKYDLVEIKFIKKKQETASPRIGHSSLILNDEPLSYAALAFTPRGEEIAKRLFVKRKCYIRPVREQQHTVFIACAFGKQDIDLLYKTQVEKCISKNKLEPYRVDLKEPHQTITNSIIENIKNARCLIADLTYARQSVYFEIGFAVGLGIPFILTCREDHRNSIVDESKVHFDLQQFKISYWEKNNDDSFSWAQNMTPEERLSKILKE